MTMTKAWLSVSLTLLLAGCVHDHLVQCDDGRSCPAGTVCTATSCADQTAVDACNGVAEGATCNALGLPDGVCATNVCVARGCGNGTVDADSTETCDDGNTVSGDGCTSTCELEACGNGRPDAIETCDDSNTISHDGCSNTCQREVAQWTSLEPSDDDERAGAAMQFIPGRNRIVRFGGFDFYGAPRSGTFELVDTHWVRVATTHAPSARGYSASAYDSARDRWVLFGGSIGPSYVGETWEFDGTDWTQRPVSGPPDDAGAMTYDSTAHRIVLYVDDPTAQTWTYDGSAWTQLTGSTQPTARRETSIAFDPIGNRTILFGGTNTSGIKVNDTWVLTGTTWTPLTTTGTPTARTGHSLVYDPTRNGLVLTGGGSDSYLLQGSTWSPIPGSQPRDAAFLGVVFDPLRNELVRYGGSHGFEAVFDDIYQLSASNGWEQLNPLGPLDCTATLTATDTKRDRVLIYGGQSFSDSERDDTWAFDATGWHHLSPSTTPPATSYAGMAYDVARDRVVAVIRTGTWEFDGTDWRQITTAVNTPHYLWDAVYDPDHARVLGIQNLMTYVYDGSDWTAVPGAPDVGINEYTLTYDPDQHVVMMFGLDALWKLDGTTWTQVASGPRQEDRYRAKIGYDPIRHRLILVAGETQATGKQNDTWEWDGTAWTQVTTMGTYSPRETPAFAWLPSAGAFLMFGGNDRDISMHDTWLLHWDPL